MNRGEEAGSYASRRRGGSGYYKTNCFENVLMVCRTPYIGLRFREIQRSSRSGNDRERGNKARNCVSQCHVPVIEKESDRDEVDELKVSLSRLKRLLAES